MKLRTRIFTLLFLFVFLSHPLFSHICIDVHEFHFKSTSTTGLRLSVFDTNTQTYKHIGYYPHTAASSTRGDSTIEEWEGLKISHDFEVSLPQDFKLENYIIRTKGKFVLPPQWSTNTDYVLREETNYKILYKNFSPKEPKDILQKLQSFKKTILTPLFKVQYNKEEKSFTAIRPLSTQENNDERGIIGEIATTMAMYSFGWFRNLPTQNGSNQGLDGAFLDPSDKFLFLTESKCRDQSCNAKKYLEKEMSEEEILSKLKRTGTPEKTKEFIEAFLTKTPECVYKAAHRLMPSGHSQWAVEPLNYGKYAQLTLSPKSSEKDMISLFQNVIGRTGLSPENAFLLFLKANKWTPAQAINFLQGGDHQLPVTPLSSSVSKQEVQEPPEPPLPSNATSVQRKLEFSAAEIPEGKVPEYSSESLKKLVQELNKKIPNRTLAGYMECEAKILEKLAKGKKINTPEKRWKSLMGNMETLCKDHQLDKNSLLLALQNEE